MENYLSYIPKIMTIIEGNIMRLDYISYVVAVICFLLAAIVFAITPAYISDTTIVYTLTGVLAVLGLILAGVGYSQRPKKTMLPPPTPPSATPTTSTTSAPTPASVPTTTAPMEETKKTEEEIKSEKKPVRKRRRKT